MPGARLEVVHGVPVVLQEDDGVGRGQVQAQAAHVRGQQHDGYAGVCIEALHQPEARARLHAAQAHTDTCGMPVQTPWALSLSVCCGSALAFAAQACWHVHTGLHIHC